MEAVKKLPKTDYDEIDNYCFVSSFKIYSDTSFDTLRIAACKFWKIENAMDHFILTDEYFNNLASYKDTIQHFFD